MNVPSWSDLPHFAGIDYARLHHVLVVMDRQGAVCETLDFAHDPEGWAQLRTLVQRYPRLPVAVETSQGAVVEQLLDCDLRVYPVNPKAAERYRERQAPAGTKDDEQDAATLADALRLDGAGWRELQPRDPIVLELQLLCRDEIALIEQRTALVNQLRQCLHDYYPAALEAFEDWVCPASWTFVQRFPTPAQLQQAGRRQWEKFLHAHKLWRPQTAERRLAVFARATALSGSAATVAAKSLLAVTLARLLETLELQLDQYRQRIVEVFGRHPDHDLFGSLPGAGPKLAPRLLAEIGDNRARFTDVLGLQCLAGTAPITRQTGNGKPHQFIRWACNDSLRATIHLWADHSRHKCAWAEVYYQSHRQAGQSHACALRCLGQRWLKIIWAMWQTRTPYNESLHARNQLRHGSWVLALQSDTPSP
ncbi:MAG TPA: IS110 family transposase [Trinickia sp.]|uniref:IS110 family transposase n=1 Tax=Trinickia sp. TaxID=2571163 RepID=UPI002BBA5689|nr:IS110 family transposase [Trinickia sp.]HVW49809.1 IS110 family transposase [Trinickia sp.]